MSIMAELESLKSRFENAGQAHVFRFWDELDDAQKKNLLQQASEIDLEEVDRLVDELIRQNNGAEIDFSNLEPAPCIKHPKKGGDTSRWVSARQKGEELIRAGKVAAFTVAGGQGTRLGFDGPKGTFPVSPVQKKTLFNIFADKIRGASERYGVTIPWFIMTSHANNAATVGFFLENDFFGLDKENVHFFTQGRMPAVDLEGKILLEDKGSIAMSPDGHGGSLRALVRSGAVDKMKEAGIDYLSYFQVDNPLVRVIDPEFIGFHAEAGSEMSSKMIPKAHSKEKVGHFCQKGDKVVVIEYSDMPDELAEQTDEKGDLRFNAGSIAIHVISRDFVERVGEGKDVQFRLPFHRADKKIPTVDIFGNEIQPDEPNGVKFEMFVFDALPFAKNPVVIETLREEDFSPVKNAEGSDSPKTCHDDQLKQWTRWLKMAGVSIPLDEQGVPQINFEISRDFADDEQTFAEAWAALDTKPEIVDGLIIG